MCARNLPARIVWTITPYDIVYDSKILYYHINFRYSYSYIDKMTVKYRMAMFNHLVCVELTNNVDFQIQLRELHV